MNKKLERVEGGLGGLSAVREKILGDGLPNLDSIDTNFTPTVKPMAPEEEAKAEEEANRRKDFAERAGELTATIEENFRQAVAVIDAEIVRLANHPQLQFSPDLRNRLAKARDDRKSQEEKRDAALARLRVDDEGLTAHMAFATFRAEIVQTAEAIRTGRITLAVGNEIAQAHFNKAVADGRIEAVAEVKGGESGLLFLGDQAYQQKPDNTDKATKPNAAIANELRKLVEALKSARRQERKAEAGALKAKADFTLTTVCVGKPGLVYCFVPRHEVKAMNGEKHWAAEAHLLLRCDGKNLFPAEAVAGKGLEDLWAVLTARGVYVTITELWKGKPGFIKDNEVFRLTRKYLDILLDAMKAIPAPEPTEPTAAAVRPATVTPVETSVDKPVVPAKPLKKKGANLKKAAAKETKNEGTK